MNIEILRETDSEIANVIELELQRQRDHLELIASENFTSQAVMEAIGSHFTNKYAEGYPGARFYGGCEFADMAENIARDRAKELFGAEHANVQPHSGSQANMSVYYACLKPGDTILGLNLSHGGHLTHGSPASITGKYFNSVFYSVDKDTEIINYDEVLRIAKQCKPKILVAGASAYPRTLDFAKFKEIADAVGAYLMVDMAHIAGLVAAGCHPSPVPHADFVTTTTHKTLRGPRGGIVLCKKEHAKKIDSAVFPGTQGGPLMHTISAKAVCLKEAMQPEFVIYQQQVVENAKALAKRLNEKGVRLVSGGTDTHLVLADVGILGRTGMEIQHLLERANITSNKNTIPFDKQIPSLASGVRFGTPAVTTRGMKQVQLTEIADLISTVIFEGEAAVPSVKAKVLALTKQFPLY